MTDSASPRPWERLPSQLAALMRPRLAGVRAEVERLIDADAGWSGRMVHPSVREDVVAASSAAVSRFVELIGTRQDTFGAADRERFRRVGAGEAREGRGLEELLAAYRIGTRVLYAAFAEGLAELDPSPQAQVALGEAVFALMDALHAESADGYANEVSTHAGERDRRLRRLAEALFAGEQDALPALAAQVGWTVPDTVAVVLVAADSVAPHGTVGARGFLVERDGLGVLVVGADRGRPQVARTLDQLALAGPVRVGAVVPLAQARRSLATAALLPETDGRAWAADHLPSLLLSASPDLAATVVEEALAPLAALRASQRARLTATLAAWLRHWGQRTSIAAELGVHPQTVAYRVNQLRDLFGPRLDDPAWRLAAQLALLAPA